MAALIGEAAPAIAARRRRATGWLIGTALACAGSQGELEAQTVAQLVEVTDIAGLAASPDGAAVAFRTERARLDTNGYDLVWHVAETDGGGVRPIGGGGAPVYAEPGVVRGEQAFWSPDGRFVFYRALVDERIGLWRAAADGAGAVAAAVGDANLDGIEPAGDGRSLVLRFGPTRDEIVRAEQREYDEGVLVDASVDLAQAVHRGAFVDGRKATQRLTGYWFTRGGLLWEQPRRQQRLDLESLEVFDAGTLAVPRPGPAAVAPDLVVRDGKGRTATVTRAPGGSRVTVELARGGDPIVCDARQCGERIVAAAWRPGRDEILLTAQDSNQMQSLHLWKVGSAVVRTLARGDGLLSGGREARTPCAVTEREAVCVSAGPLSPPRLDAIDLDSGVRRTLFDPNASLRGGAGLEAELLEWRAGDGQTFAGTLLKPRGAAQRLPLVIHYYRCEGYLRGGVGDEVPLAPLAAAGIATLCINAPPFTGPHKAEETYRTALAGISAVVAMLGRRGTVDPARVGIAGLSFGSEVAMWTAMNSDLLAAVSIASTQFEPAYYWLNAVRGRDQPAMLERVWGLGAPDRTRQAWKRMSPALNVDRLRAPILMQLPEQEAREVIELYARLTNSPTPAELYVFPDEAHIKVLPRHKRAVYRRNLDWFRFWLQGHADPDPERAAQFSRWRELQRRSRQPRQERSQSSVAASSSTRK